MEHIVADAIALVAAMAIVVFIATIIALSAAKGRTIKALFYAEPLFCVLYVALVVTWLYLVVRLYLTIALELTINTRVAW